MLTRRQFVTGLAAVGLGPPGLGRVTAAGSGHGALSIGHQAVNFTGRPARATTVNGSLPGPVLHWKEGELVTMDVTNRLPETSSIHWHGIILPSNMDGVPGLSFAGIPPGGTWRYQFRLQQSGTYWYHSHSGFQEQTGVYGAIVIDPAGGPLHPVERDYVVVLSDWSDESPARIFRNLRRNSHFYNRNRRSLGDLLADVERQGMAGTLAERSMWNRMRMQDTDLSDVTGFTYTYLMNGRTPAAGWEALYRPGERIRLRIINASAMTFFDVRIPGLKMRVVAADGQDIHPVTVDDLRLGVAETLDVIVTPTGDGPYAVFAQAIDRSGYALGHLTPAAGVRAEPPPLDPLPRLSHTDMGMGGGHTHHGQAPRTTAAGGTDGGHAHHHGGQTAAVTHAATEFGPHVDMRASNPQYRLDDPGVGLRHLAAAGRRVLTYADMTRLAPVARPDPDREIELHLTGNMERYLWSINGIPYPEAEELRWQFGERIRVTFVNDTMMNHPMHLHGMWSELETGADFLPLKHTVVVQPGAKISYQVQVDARGRWAYHCHMMYHMMDMFREVRVT